MLVRKLIEQREKEQLCEFATLSIDSKGRSQYNEAPDDLRTCFQRDRDRILHSHSFSRLQWKAQVFLLTSNDHYKNRLTHTLEVAQVARTIGRALRLNEDLIEAIAYLHDLAHPAFQHPGEEALNELNPNGFHHSTAVKRRAMLLEHRNEEIGLNLTHEVIDGAIHHSGFTNNPSAATKEGMIIPFADKFAYLTSDMENAISEGLIKDVPQHLANVLGQDKSKMLDTMIRDVISNSQGIPSIRMSSNMFEAVKEFRAFMFEKVYLSQQCLDKAQKAKKIITELFEHLTQNPGQIPVNYTEPCIEQRVTDYISSMTDRYAANLYKDTFLI